MSDNVYESPNASLESNQFDEPVSLTAKQILFSFNGRITRSTYWLSFLGLVGAMFVLLLILGLLGLGEDAMAGIYILFYIPIVWCSLAIQVKRWHYRGKSGWWVLISFVPIIGPIWAFIENGCLAGTEGSNRFGPPAK